MFAKRSRSVNFTKEEELLLIEEVSKYKAIIECKTTNKLNWNEKEKAWKKIVANFNAKNSNVRKLDQIRAKYDSLKCKARKDVAKLKSCQRGTGGGPCTSFSVDTSTDAVLDLMNLKTVMGHDPKNDSDRIETIIEANKENIQTNVVNANESVLELNVNDENIQTNEPVLELNVNDENIQTNESVLELNVNDILIVEGESSTTSNNGSDNLDTIISSEKHTQESPSENWNKYVPHKLKKTAHQKLRPKISNPAIAAKTKYYVKKSNFLEKENLRQIQRDLREKEKHVRDIKEQDLRIKILEIELKLKQKCEKQNL